MRGVFVEGQPIYPDAGFHEKTHIQIAVRNAACIKGRVSRPKAAARANRSPLTPVAAEVRGAP